MDILPAIPEDDNFKMLLAANRVPTEQASKAICITDNTHPSYGIISEDWPRSNPKGYADWFKNRMQVRFDARLRAVAESLKVNIEDVPEHEVKTPLQRAIQILKRHRDIKFKDDTDDKPISIIITTLAAHAYNNEEDLLDALINLVHDMPNYIETRGGVSWVSNPVNPFENFADKWQEHPQREAKFLKWIQQVQSDIQSAIAMADFKAIEESLSTRFGGSPVREAISKAGLLAAAGIAVIASDASSSEPPHVEINNPNQPWGEDE
jgi:hypothetical protein